MTDTGFQGGPAAGASEYDVFAVDIMFSSAWTLPAGTYWLAIHEGSWESANDGTPIEWYNTTAGQGSLAYFDSDEASPGDAWQSHSRNLAFQVFAVP